MKIFAISIIFVLMGVLRAPAQETHTQNGLDLCVFFYENGNYNKAVDSLKSLLPHLPEKEKPEAYKYLAFSYVMLDMVNSAKKHFDTLLTNLPDMNIDTVSIPPNITVVFKQAKLEQELKLEKAKKKRGPTALWIAGGVSAAALLAGGTYFFLKPEEKTPEKDKGSGDMRLRW